LGAIERLARLVFATELRQRPSTPKLRVGELRGSREHRFVRRQGGLRISALDSDRREADPASRAMGIGHGAFTVGSLGALEIAQVKTD
jgi:hypothetical protein